MYNLYNFVIASHRVADVYGPVSSTQFVWRIWSQLNAGLLVPKMRFGRFDQNQCVSCGGVRNPKRGLTLMLTQNICLWPAPLRRGTLYGRGLTLMMCDVGEHGHMMRKSLLHSGVV